MKLYLKWINPIVAIVILLICCWIYFGGYFVSLDGGETPFSKGEHILDVNDTGFQMYFFAKGLFCCSMLFLFGEFLKKYLESKEEKG
ncbi:hypothetical protein ACFLS1_05510 [Verrucomicrobiota bacterium]